MTSDTTARDTLNRWLLENPQRRLGIGPLVDAFAGKLRQLGIPISRLSTSVPTMHPELFVQWVLWQHGQGVTIEDVMHSERWSADFIGSPIEQVRQTGQPIRVRIGAVEALPYPQLHELKDAGVTDYSIWPLSLVGTEESYCSICTDAPAGFEDWQLDMIADTIPTFSICLELAATRFAKQSLLRLYLGPHAADRVLSGQFLRGTGQELEVAIFFCDMRGFSTFSDSAPMRTVVATLDRYFECLAKPIHDHGGEILKFIGDAVLAVFPKGGTSSVACRAAFECAQQAVAGVGALGDELAASGGPRVRAGAAVHVGKVLYGNIGAQQRLDFTVIGAAVNEAARIEALCKELDEPVLVSAAVAASLGAEKLRSVGRHVLRGIRGEHELFAPFR